LGGREREIQVNVQPHLLKQHSVSILQVVKAINQSGVDIPAGTIQTDEFENSLRLKGKFNTLKEIENVQVAMPMPGNPIYVKDIAKVEDKTVEISSVSRYNGKEGIGILLKKQGDANAVDVSRKVRERFDKIAEAYATENVQFVIADDSTDNTIEAVNAVVFDLIMAITLVSIVMLLLFI
jgi:HAE1 family hydrophobic/amphiphilic exporter-1